MPKYEVNKFRNQKKVDRLNKPRETFLDFVRDFTVRFDKHLEEYKIAGKLYAPNMTAPGAVKDLEVFQKKYLLYKFLIYYSS